MSDLGYLMSMRLRQNWLYKADSMDCNVEFRITDPLSRTDWYIYAQDVDNPSKLLAIVDGGSAETLDPAVVVDYITIKSLFDLDGEYLVMDNEFVPRLASVIYKKLKEEYDNQGRTPTAVW